MSMLPEGTNYYECMNSALYNVTVDSMALVNSGDADNYVMPTRITMSGKKEVIESRPISVAINILDMISIHKKNYPIIIANSRGIKEIVEIIYGHITKCIEAKERSIFNAFTVSITDLLEMEDFMIDIMKANHDIIKNTVADEIEEDMSSMYNGVVTSTDDANAKNELIEKFRRIGNSNVVSDISLGLSELLDI